MVQERNLERPKFQDQDIDQRLRRPVVREKTGKGTSLATDTATGLALLLSIVSFFFSSIAVIQAVRTHRDTEAILQVAKSPPAKAAVPAANAGSQTSKNTLALPGNLPPIAQRIQPGRFVEPAYSGAGQIELLSADRGSGASDLNIVSLKMRVQRVREQVRGVGDINLAQIVALNTRTNERYPTIDFRTPYGNALSLYSLPLGSSVDVTVMLRVPQGLDRVDLQIPETIPFRGVPIGVSSRSTAPQ